LQITEDPSENFSMAGYLCIFAKLKNNDMYKILSLLLIVTSFTISLQAQPSGYYDEATGTGYTLKTQLHNIIDDHNSQSYSALWTHFQTLEVDHYYENDGSPLDVYSEVPDGQDPYNFVFGEDQCGNYSGEGSCYNREHSFPKSWFNDASPMYTDLYHLYLTDGYVNGQRGNYPFGEVDNPSWTSLNGSKKGTCSYPGYSGTVFEPIDEYKGDFARTYFYMATRYEDVITSWSSPALNGTSDQVYEDWYLNMMIEWHTNDPVSQKEIDRNNGIYEIQNNRNPFIDHAEWVYQIWGGAPNVEEPDNHLTNLEAATLNYNSIALSWTDATGTNLPAGYVIKVNTTGDFSVPEDGSDPTEDLDLTDGEALIKVTYGVEQYSFSELNEQTTYYFKTWPYVNFDDNIDFKLDGEIPTTSVTTGIAPIPLFEDNFEGDLSAWTVVNDEASGAEAVISPTWSGAEQTANALLFDGPYPTDIQYYTSTITKSFTQVAELSLQLWYYFEDYRGGELAIFVNDEKCYSITTEGPGDEAIQDGQQGIWHQLNLDLTAYTADKGNYDLTIEGESKCADTWTDRMAIDQVKVFGRDLTSVKTPEKTNFTVYPNPATEQITIQSNTPQWIFMYNSMGSLVNKQWVKHSVTMNVSELQPGIYMIKSGESENYSTKMVIQ
jgi:endonuclease I